MNAWSKGTIYLAVGMMAAGFLLIVLAWNGAASKDFVQGQFPYLISGGLAGIGLIIGGIALTVVQEMRKNTAMVLRRLDDMLSRMEAAPGERAEQEENLPAPRITREDDTSEIDTSRSTETVALR